MYQRNFKWLTLFILSLGLSIISPLSMAKEKPMSADILISFFSSPNKQIRPCPNPHFASYCTLTISSGTGLMGAIQVTNQSATITATNITALIPSGINGLVSLQPPTQITLAPGASDTFTFFAAGPAVPPTLVEVKGDNTQSGFFYIQVA